MDPAASSTLADAAEVPSPKSSTTYNEDVVEITQPDGSRTQAVVTRCWADEQSPEVMSEAQRLNIPFTPLSPGYLEVLHPDGTRSNVLESAVTLVDKGFLRGDIVRPRRSPDASGLTRAPQLGQIVGLKTEVKLQRVLTGEHLEGWHDADALVAAKRVCRGDHVVEPESGWLGVIEEVFDMAMIEAGNAGLVRRVCDTGMALTIGNASEAIKNMLEERGEGILAQFLGATDLKQVLDIKQCMIAVNWLCRNQQATTDSWDRPKRYWTELSALVHVRHTMDHLHTIHDRVVFRDRSLFPIDPAASRWSEIYPEGHRVMTITATRTDATVLWQDGTTTTRPTPEFEQVHAVDEESDVFPGDIGLFSGVTPPRIGVVQSMDSRRRTMKLRYLSDRAEPLPAEGGESASAADATEEVVSGLEFDPHGPPPDAYGVRRGDWVLITKEGVGNGAQVPTVPTLGESEIAAGLMPAGDELRKEISTRGLSFCQNLADLYIPPTPLSTPEALAPITWYGEVWDLLLDGRALVRFPSGDRAAFPVHRLVHIDDGMDPEGELAHDHDHDDGDIAMASDGGSVYETDASSERSWLTETEDEEMEDADASALGGLLHDDVPEAEEDSQDEDYATDEGADGEAGQEAAPRRSRRKRRRGEEETKGWADEDEEEADTPVATIGVDAPAAGTATDVTPAARDDVPASETTSAAAPSEAVPKGTAAGATSVSMPGEIEDYADWSRFEVLEEAPPDHHYINEAPQVPSKTFMSRMRKEHQVLSTSLPPNILVRAYENRTDLLRCLIIGPLDTPFQNAPFLFDVYLPPAKFPQDPPQVFFHSWTSGNRVSPNLYVEGKVCLSLLGTWSGDKDENWSAAKSSILQIFISIQGLIMVENPYYTEPGFEKQMGTPEATAASELYNERTLVLTRAFVKRACEYPPASFEREIAAYFFHGLPGQNGGALAAIIEQSHRLLEESERWHAREADRAPAAAEGSVNADGAGEGEADDAKPPQSTVIPSQRVLTEGAGLSLRRTVKALEELVQRGPKVDPPK